MRLCLSAMLVSFVLIGMNAQVTIGSGSPPSEWSLLDLDASDIPRALHLPRLDNTARDYLVSPASLQSDQDLAVGLMIFNTETRCLEFWNGTEWISRCVGDTPIRGCPVRVPYSVNPSGWLTFMCHNLGADPNMTIAEQMAYVHTDIYDHTVYGYLFQWGRAVDGHQSRTSSTVVGPLTTGLDGVTGQPTPVENRFITNPELDECCWDWRIPQVDDLWTRNYRANDPCPPGWRVPTIVELESIVGVSGSTSVDINTNWQVRGENYVRWVPAVVGTAGILIRPIESPEATLFLPAAGWRHLVHGELSYLTVNAFGYYWSSTANGVDAGKLGFGQGQMGFWNRDNRAFGFSVRCVAE